MSTQADQTSKKMIFIEGSSFKMGTNSKEGFEADREGPVTDVAVDDFYISPYTVTNQEFLDFYLETGYITEAERYGSSYVFHLSLDKEIRKQSWALAGTEWWYEVPEANWRKPEGGNSTIQERMDHPVVHVTRNDALAYCDWAGARLPTEAEWEYAARGGLKEKRFPWGDDLHENKQHHANIWQGDFPLNNTKEDGYLGTAPVHSYEPNGFGLYQMSGNVWEWCLNPGKVPLEVFQNKVAKDFIKDEPQFSDGLYALRGGSFLCHCSYCQRYRVAGRNSNTANSSTSNIGFCIVQDVQ